MLKEEIRAYNGLQIPVPKLSGQEFVIPHARCKRTFRGGERNDWIWIASDNAGTQTFNGRLVRRLNALFKLRSRETVYRLTYVTPLQFLGGATVQGVEGMLRVRWPTDVESIVVRIAAI